MIFETLLRYHFQRLNIDWDCITRSKLSSTQEIVQMKLPQRNYSPKRLFRCDREVIDLLSGQRYCIDFFHRECLTHLSQAIANTMIWYVVDKQSGECSAGMLLKRKDNECFLTQFVACPRQETCMALWVLLIRMVDRKKQDLVVSCISNGPLQWPLVFSAFMQTSVNRFLRPCLLEIHTSRCLLVKYVLQCDRALEHFFLENEKTKSDIKH